MTKQITIDIRFKLNLDKIDYTMDNPQIESGDLQLEFLINNKIVKLYESKQIHNYNDVDGIFKYDLLNCYENLIKKSLIDIRNETLMGIPEQVKRKDK